MLDKKFIAEEKNLAQDFFITRLASDSVIFVGGRALFWYNELFLKRGCSPKFIVDNNKDKWGTTLFNIPVGSFDDVKKIFDIEHLKAVVSAPKYKSELTASIKNNLGDIPIYSFESEIYCSFCTDVDAYRTYLLRNYHRLEWLYSNLADDKSKLVLNNFLKGRITADQDFFIDIMEPNQYFPDDIIKFSDSEVIVELGSNDGKTLIDVLNRVQRRYDKIFCFEPDKQALKLLHAVVSRENGDIHIVEKATGAKNGLVSFFSNADYGVSKISEVTDSSYNVEVVRVDDVIDAHVTYIKMDIEGAELDSLHGMEKIIKRDVPTLAICVYHNNEDILDIPEYIHSLVPCANVQNVFAAS